jgi:hypothetical protein
MSISLRDTARAWGVPPWVITGEAPTREVVSRWVRIERFCTSLGL